jgi:predicted metalloprotease
MEPESGPPDSRWGLEDRMRWQGRRQSTNVEDRRGVSGGQVAVGGGILGVIIALVLGLVFGLNPSSLTTQSTTASTTAAQADEMKQFVSVVLADTEDFWTQEFQQLGKTYQPTTLVLFSGTTSTGSGMASSATGPFYSPADEKVYIDLSFYDEMKSRFGAGGDNAEAYVIAHEVGHHVQDLLGVLDQVDSVRQRVSETEANELSVRLELQADFYAGLWDHYEGQQKYLQPGDVEEALNAANAIGDDRLQQQAQGRVVPDSFTHGTSEQRVRWFRLGYDSGDITKGDTFTPAYESL